MYRITTWVVFVDWVWESVEESCSFCLVVSSVTRPLIMLKKDISFVIIHENEIYRI